ncbi:hypothetical protein MTBPR1_100137 [Candidatus Terasakiella magnetica]|uniref:Uncharacterized protein n=1 Tax=Candidatus Terasakiella magnetica TaxID=1867952 RepID=A0A1C3RDX7_9PROT|nr:hypothetical protein MTBPR1_100137 [Candidatus Terasakiella magnetica]
MLRRIISFVLEAAVSIKIKDPKLPAITTGKPTGPAAIAAFVIPAKAIFTVANSSNAMSYPQMLF